ncbi:MAG: 2-amino-4-hydroxy-6-hydroxymethyldihydropteridine diphosphokinase [Pseudomonadota bacterium]
MSVLAYVALGSNLDNPRQQVEQAIQALGQLPATRLQAASPLYRSAPIGQPGQADYINAVAALYTELEAESLLDALQATEHVQGRVRDGTRWGSRTLDLDILLYGDAQIDTARLTVPHPELTNRPFVMEPLYALDPDLEIPGCGALSHLRTQVDCTDLERLESTA